jgi:hypothetical protein
VTRRGKQRSLGILTIGPPGISQLVKIGHLFRQTIFSTIQSTPIQLGKHSSRASEIITRFRRKFFEVLFEATSQLDIISQVLDEYVAKMFTVDSQFG